MTLVEVSDFARADAFETAVDLAAESPASADRFIDAFEATIRKIAEYPGSGGLAGSKSSDLRDCRTWPVRGFENWRIYYRVAPEKVVVSRVIHVARDV